MQRGLRQVFHLLLPHPLSSGSPLCPALLFQHEQIHRSPESDQGLSGTPGGGGGGGGGGGRRERRRGDGFGGVTMAGGLKLTISKSTFHSSCSTVTRGNTLSLIFLASFIGSTSFSLIFALSICIVGLSSRITSRTWDNGKRSHK